MSQFAMTPEGKEAAKKVRSFAAFEACVRQARGPSNVLLLLPSLAAAVACFMEFAVAYTPTHGDFTSVHRSDQPHALAAC